MARTKAELSAGSRLADYLTIGYLALNCPLDKVRQALLAHDAQSKRQRGLPHEVLVYFVMAMVLYANVAYEEVLRLVIEGLRQALGDEGVARATVTKGAISQARGQVGVGPLRQLYREQVRCHGPVGMPGVWYGGLRVMAIDGSEVLGPGGNCGTLAATAQEKRRPTRPGRHPRDETITMALPKAAIP